jgi:hypothetical protein
MQIAWIPAVIVYYLLVLSAFGDYFLLEKQAMRIAFKP